MITTVRTHVHRLHSCILACVALLVGAVLFMPAPASAAITSSVRSACMSDYFAYCAGLAVGSTELRRCMSRAGPRLSQGCINALVAAGEVSRSEVSRRQAASSRGASRSARASQRRGKRMATMR